MGHGPGLLTVGKYNYETMGLWDLGSMELSDYGAGSGTIWIATTRGKGPSSMRGQTNEYIFCVLFTPFPTLQSYKWHMLNTETRCSIPAALFFAHSGVSIRSSSSSHKALKKTAVCRHPVGDRRLLLKVCPPASVETGLEATDTHTHRAAIAVRTKSGSWQEH